MSKFIVTVYQTSSDHKLDPEDLDYRPEGAYLVAAEDTEEALDRFHEIIPIACLEDYEVDAIEFKGEL